MLFPPLSWLAGGPRAVGVASAVAAAALFEPLVRARFGPAARYGALWLGVATGTLLFTGRMPFALGVALGLAALLTLQRERRLAATALAVACALASPVAGLFLALAGIAYALASPRERRGGLAVALGALLPPLALALAFPEGGRHPFVLSAFLPIPLFGAAALALLPRRERALRIGVALYALAGTAAFALDTPMGGNATRLGALFGGPVLACALAAHPPRLPRRLLVPALVLVLGALAWWQWSPAVRDTAAVLGEPTAERGHFEPLARVLTREGPPRGRVEVVATVGHWEAADLAPSFPLARGWERQLDAGRNRLFYEGGGDPLDPRDYARWLVESGVDRVALPLRGGLDYSAEGEARLVRGGPPYLEPRYRTHDWLVYEVRLPGAAIVVPERGAEIDLRELGPDEAKLAVRRPGAALVRVRWTPYWEPRGAGGCVERAGEWTRIVARRPGLLRLRARFAPERLLRRGRRCDR